MYLGRGRGSGFDEIHSCKILDQEVVKEERKNEGLGGGVGGVCKETLTCTSLS